MNITRTKKLLNFIGKKENKMKHRICSHCGERYPDTDKYFYASHTHCKGCADIYNYLYLELNKEARRAYFKEYNFLFGKAKKVPSLNKIRKMNLAEGIKWKDRVSLREDYLADYKVYKKVK